MTRHKHTIGGLAAAIAILFAAPMSDAHEFWISPEAGKVAAGDTIRADLKVGLMLEGESYPYLSNRFTRFEVISAGGRLPVTGSQGDLPALARLTARPGLNVIAHQTVAFRAMHDDWALFQRYLREEGLTEFEQVHIGRGLPRRNFAERYTRYAKALIQAGPVREGDGDLQTGMKLELTASGNPYREGATDLPIALTWQGSPLANRQINVFHKKEGITTRESVVTDVNGRARIALNSAGEYLLNAVHLVPPDDRNVAWASHWATLSFKL